MQAIYTAASGLNNQQTRLDVIAANVANSDTAGYKSTRVDFKDALYSLMVDPAGDSETANLRRGSGVVLGATNVDFTDGTVSTTDRQLDFAINGDGFFTVQNENGETLYTRNGNFFLSAEGANRYLVTAQGYYVLDSNGNRISLPNSELSVSDGGVLSTPAGESARLGIAVFTNPDGLSAAGGTCYRATDASGGPSAFPDASITQGSLEKSNVDIAEEMTLLIRSQRAYSLASRALQTADDMEGLSNSMHR